MVQYQKFVLLIDGIYLQICVQCHSGDIFGVDKEGTLDKVVVVFRIVSLKFFISDVEKSFPEG